MTNSTQPSQIWQTNRPPFPWENPHKPQEQPRMAIYTCHAKRKATTSLHVVILTNQVPFQKRKKPMKKQLLSTVALLGIFPILGSLMLIFRIWLCEVKLVRELEFRRRYLSRFMGYFFWVAMVLDFQNDIFNLIIITELVGNIIYLVGWDIPFFLKFRNK